MAEHYYTIKDIEEMTGIPATAIRFYDKRGLLVFVKRSPNGMRIFTDRDVEKIRLIQLLRNLDMHAVISLPSSSRTALPVSASIKVPVIV